MPFSDANRATVRFSEETLWGETPAGPVMKNLNITGESLKATFGTEISNTIRADKNVADVVQMGRAAEGGIQYELRVGEMDDLFAGLLQSTWVSTLVSATIASARFSAAFITADSSALNGVLVGRHFRVSGATTSGNNNDLRVTAVSVETPTPGHARVHFAVASSAAAVAFTSEIFGAGTALRGSNLRNNTTQRSFLVEKEFADVSAVQQFTGMRVGAGELSVESRSFLTGGFTFSGKGVTTSSATVASTVTAAPITVPLNSSGNVAQIWEGSQVAGGVNFKSLTVSINANSREQDVIGSANLAGVATGRLEVTGSFNAYFENKSILDKLIADTASNIRFQVTDAAGDSYVVTIPRVKFMEAVNDIEGPNSDVMLNVDFAGTIDSSNLYAIQIDRLT